MIHIQLNQEQTKYTVHDPFNVCHNYIFQLDQKRSFKKTKFFKQFVKYVSDILPSSKQGQSQQTMYESVYLKWCYNYAKFARPC